MTTTRDNNEKECARRVKKKLLGDERANNMHNDAPSKVRCEIKNIAIKQSEKRVPNRCRCQLRSREKNEEEWLTAFVFLRGEEEMSFVFVSLSTTLV